MCCKCFCRPCAASQRSLHNEPIFRLLLKVAVKGTQQCDFLNFCGVYSPIVWMIIICIYVELWCRILCKSFPSLFSTLPPCNCKKKRWNVNKTTEKEKNSIRKLCFAFLLPAKKSDNDVAYDKVKISTLTSRPKCWKFAPLARNALVWFCCW